MKSANLRTFQNRDGVGGERRHCESRNGSYSWSKCVLKLFSTQCEYRKFQIDFILKSVKWKVNLGILIQIYRIYCKAIFFLTIDHFK